MRTGYSLNVDKDAETEKQIAVLQSVGHTLLSTQK